MCLRLQNGKKKFDKHTAKFCQSLEKYLALKTKTGDVLLQEVCVLGHATCMSVRARVCAHMLYMYLPVCACMCACRPFIYVISTAPITHSNNNNYYYITF